jgi:diaminopimelate epimerase
MRFAKYHGIGNDFIMVSDPSGDISLSSDQVRRLCDRHFGIGADGVIRVTSGSNGAELTMDYTNSDGSVGEMCGNGIRCLARFALDEGLTTNKQIKVATLAGTKVLTIEGSDVTVDMGAPVFEAEKIPVVANGADPLHLKLSLADGDVEATCLSVGNPHAVVFVDDPASVPVTTRGPLIEHHPAFPHMANAEFVRVVSPDRIEMRVWERGSGETLACGTGACAAAVAARLVAGTNEIVTVALPGGELTVEWSGSLESEASVWMTGPAEKSFVGEVDL